MGPAGPPAFATTPPSITPHAHTLQPRPLTTHNPSCRNGALALEPSGQLVLSRSTGHAPRSDRCPRPYPPRVWMVKRDGQFDSKYPDIIEPNWESQVASSFSLPAQRLPGPVQRPVALNHTMWQSGRLGPATAGRFVSPHQATPWTLLQRRYKHENAHSRSERPRSARSPRTCEETGRK